MNEREGRASERASEKGRVASASASASARARARARARTHAVEAFHGVDVDLLDEIDLLPHLRERASPMSRQRVPSSRLLFVNDSRRVDDSPLEI
jgi:hypothetical protein